MPLSSCTKLVKEYGLNCSFAGIHFIADDTKHWTERWLWAFLVALSWYGSAILTIAAWNAFVLSPISFGVETTYIDWDTKLPTVAICEEDNDERVYNVSDTIWPPDHEPDLEDVLKELAYFRGTLFYTLDHCHKYKILPLCPLTNISYYANLVRSKCPETLANCSYNGITFECCEYFQNISTDVGTCYILNSIQTENPKPYPMVNNQTSKRGVIKFEVLVPAKVYTIGEDEVPSVTTSQSSTLSVHLGYQYKRHVTVKNIENDPLVVETSPEQRACRFHYENEDGLYPHYSYSTCTVLCRKRAQMNTCKCNDHLMPGTLPEQHCNMTGLACLVTYYNHLSTLKPRWASRPGLACDCLPSCSETEITVIKDEVISKKKSKKNQKGIVEIVLAYLSTERFKRNVVRSRLDLVVSVGGTTGLFVGASLLSFVELIFYFTVRFIGNYFIENKELETGYPAETEEILAIEAVDKNIKNIKFKGPYQTSGVASSQLIYEDLPQ